MCHYAVAMETAPRSVPGHGHRSVDDFPERQRAAHVILDERDPVVVLL
jgi:hypothetical protein